MSNKLTSKSSITINAPLKKVWQALVDPELIKGYLFGTDAQSDWKEGSSITYTGEWQGKPYQDKGEIIKMIPEKLLHTTFFSPMNGKEDKPENYANVIYEIEPQNNSTIISITQDNIENEEQLAHMKQNWGMVLDNMKKLLES